MCVSSAENETNMLVFKGSNTEFSDYFPTDGTWSDWIGVNWHWDQVSYDFPPVPGVFSEMRSKSGRSRPPRGSEKVHEGFKKAWDEGQEGVLDLVTQTQPKQYSRLLVAGHSLGGSLAQMCFVHLVNRAYKGALSSGTAVLKDASKTVTKLYAYTFGAPPIGNAAFWATQNDLVTDLAEVLSNPPGFINIGGQFYELLTEMFGTLDDGHLGILAILDPFGNYAAPGVFAASLREAPADWKWLALGGWGKPLSHKIKTYRECLTRTIQSPRPKVGEAKSWAFVAQGISGAAGSGATVTMYIGDDKGHSQMLFNWGMDGGKSRPGGHNLVLTGERPPFWQAADIRFRFNLGSATELTAESMALFLDSYEVWRRDDVSIKASGEAWHDWL